MVTRRLFAAIVLAGMLSGCATGAKYGEVASSFPTLSPSQGRIYFYRPSAFGAGVQPEVRLNGQKVGTAKPHGFYFVDRAPGNYEVAASTEAEKKLTFTLASSEERYVRLVVDKAEAESELKSLSYIAEPLK
jgi:uncharacterized protein DUF2846